MGKVVKSIIFRNESAPALAMFGHSLAVYKLNSEKKQIWEGGQWIL